MCLILFQGAFFRCRIIRLCYVYITINSQIEENKVKDSVSGLSINWTKIFFYEPWECEYSGLY